MAKLTEKLVLGRARARSFDAVKNLNCWGSGLTDVSIIDQLQNVEVINASANLIDGLRAFSKCYKLKELYLRKNAIKSLNEVVHLKALKELRILWLSGNPCCDNISNEEYRLAVIKALPMLTKLDNVAVTIEELQRAKEEGSELASLQQASEETTAQKLTEKAIAPKETEDEEKITTKNDSEETQQESKPDDTGRAVESSVTKDDSDLKIVTTDSALKKETNSDEKSTEESPHDEYNDTKSYAVDETNELRRQLGLKPLPIPSAGVPTVRSARTPRTLGQSTTSINVLTATFALIKEMDEEALVTINDAVQDRLCLLRKEETCDTIEEISETSRSSNLTNGTNSPEKDDTPVVETV